MKKKVLTAILMGMLGSAAQANVIDLFDVLQTPVKDYTSGGSVGDILTGTNGVGSTQDDPSYPGPLATILGGQRDLAANKISGGSNFDGTSIGVVQDGSDPSLRYLSFSNDAGVIGEGLIVWDGQDDSDWKTFNPTGLGGVDITDGGTLSGFVLTTISADADWQFTIEIYTDANQWSAIDLQAHEVPSGSGPVTSYIPFAPFALPETICDADPNTVDCRVGASGPVDLTNVGAMRVHLNIEGTRADIDLRLDSVAVPEPTSLALLSLGLLGIGAYTRRKGKALAA